MGFGAILGAIAPSLIQGGIGSLLNQGNSKAADKAMGVQSDIAREMLKLMQQQASIDLPFKKDVFGALRNRLGAKRQGFNPIQTQATNPLARRRAPGAMTPPGAGAPPLSGGAPPGQGPPDVSTAAGAGAAGNQLGGEVGKIIQGIFSGLGR